MVNGAIIDDIDYYNRVSEMLHVLTSKANRDNSDIEGFDTIWDNDANYATWTADGYKGIPGGGGQNKKFIQTDFRAL